MSRSNNNNIENPSTRWFEWSGAEGTLSYYDKLTKERINVPLPFTFLVLDRLHTVKGYDKDLKASIWSNEVKNIADEIVQVRKGTTTIASGIYKNIKDRIKAEDGKYAQSCYIAYKGESGKLEIGNIMFSGSSLSGGEHSPGKEFKPIKVPGFMDFVSAVKQGAIDTKAIVMEKDDRMCVNGSVKFYAPKFSLNEVSEETNNQAVELDKVLQLFLDAYIEKNKASMKADSNTTAVALPPVAPQQEQQAPQTNNNNAAYVPPASRSNKTATEVPPDDFGWDNGGAPPAAESDELPF